MRLKDKMRIRRIRLNIELNMAHNLICLVTGFEININFVFIIEPIRQMYYSLKTINDALLTGSG